MSKFQKKKKKIESNESENIEHNVNAHFSATYDGTHIWLFICHPTPLLPPKIDWICW